MSETKDNRDGLAALFRDTVLVLGGVFAVRGTDDETIHQVARGLESAYRRACRATRNAEPERTALRLAPHPAMARLLRLIDSEETET